MKKFMSIAIAFLLALSVVPAMAADQTNSTMESTTSQAVDKAPATFQAFSNLAATEREALTPLTDKELEAIEGSFLDDICVVCLNIAIVEQTNAAAQTAVNTGALGEAENSARQSNFSNVRQDIN
jgi:putative cell wall-binding protein